MTSEEMRQLTNHRKQAFVFTGEAHHVFRETIKSEQSRVVYNQKLKLYMQYLQFDESRQVIPNFSNLELQNGL